MPVDLSTRGTRELNVTVVTMFDKGVSNAAALMSDVLRLFGEETSDSAENVYFYPDSDFSLNKVPKGTDMITFEGVSTFEHRIGNEWYARGISIDLRDYLNDKIGRYRQIFRTTGMTVGLHPSRTAEATIANSETLICYDGKPLIATDHPIDPKDPSKGTWSNKLVQPAGLTFTTFAAAMAAMAKFPYSDGKSAGAKPTYLVVGTQYQDIGWDIANNPLPAGGSGGGNPWKGRVELLVIPNLTEDAWFLVDTRIEGEMPWILQEREPLQLRELQTDPQDPKVRESYQLRWLIDGSVVAGVGEPRRVLKSVKS